MSDSLWFRYSAFCSVHPSLLLCLAGETAVINKTLRWSAHPAVKHWSWSSLHHFGVRANMISHHPLFSFFGGMSAEKKNLFCVDVVWKIQKHTRVLDDTYSANISQKKSDILWWHVLVIQCSLWNIESRGMLVLTLITVGLACLLQLSASVKLDQSTQQHVFQTRTLFCLSTTMMSQGAARTLLIYLLAFLMLRVTKKRNNWCTHVDTGTRALVCDTSQWTSRDEGFHLGKLSHALWGKLFSRSCFVRVSVRQEALQK